MERNLTRTPLAPALPAMKRGGCGVFIPIGEAMVQGTVPPLPCSEEEYMERYGALYRGELGREVRRLTHIAAFNERQRCMAKRSSGIAMATFGGIVWGLLIATLLFNAGLRVVL